MEIASVNNDIVTLTDEEGSEYHRFLERRMIKSFEVHKGGIAGPCKINLPPITRDFTPNEGD